MLNYILRNIQFETNFVIKYKIVIFKYSKFYFINNLSKYLARDL